MIFDSVLFLWGDKAERNSWPYSFFLLGANPESNSQPVSLLWYTLCVRLSYCTLTAMAYASVIIPSSIVQHDVANIVTVSIVCALNSITISIFRSHNQPSTIYSANALSPVRRRSCARVSYSLIHLFCPANSGKDRLIFYLLNYSHQPPSLSPTLSPWVCSACTIPLFMMRQIIHRTRITITLRSFKMDL